MSNAEHRCTAYRHGAALSIANVAEESVKKKHPLLAFALISIAVIASAADVSPPVTIDTGALTGVMVGDILVYRGIPYAAPPVGELRWRPPQPPAQWQGVRAFDEFGPACPQHARADRPGVLKKIDEDCLSLNIWAPARPSGQKRPVMVWIHGGAFVQGSGSWPFYDGAELAGQGVVVVTINYRVGRLGFFAHPALTAEDPHGPLGNYGLMDQIAALEWVQRNIAAFGGDPDTVTIFGESAGGASVNYLMISPLSKGLFHRAIAQSGGGHQVTVHIRKGLPGRGQPLEARGSSFAKEQGITGANALTELRALPMEKVLGEPGRRAIGFGPVIDGVVVPADIGVLFGRGEQHDVPFMVGANDYEGSLTAAFAITPEMIKASAGEEAEALWAAYAGDGIDDEKILANKIWGDASFVAGARYLAGKMSTVSSPAYLYHFTYLTSGRRGQIPGAPHGGDVPYVFGNVEKLTMFRGMVKTEDVAMGKLVSGYWVQFAKTGNPNGGGRPHWPVYETASDALLELGEEVAVRTGFAKEKMDIFDARYLRRVGLASE
jgi:para-nitrobenzyl esterase